MTNSISQALEETNHRREKQCQYNIAHGITPQTISKAISGTLQTMSQDYLEESSPTTPSVSKDDLKNFDKRIKEYTKKMKDAAANLEFEEAMKYRDKIRELERQYLKN